MTKICARCGESFSPPPEDECFLTCAHCRRPDTDEHHPPKLASWDKVPDWGGGRYGFSPADWDNTVRAYEDR